MTANTAPEDDSDGHHLHGEIYIHKEIILGLRAVRVGDSGGKKAGRVAVALSEMHRWRHSEYKVKRRNAPSMKASIYIIMKAL